LLNSKRAEGKSKGQVFCASSPEGKNCLESEFVLDNRDNCFNP